MMAKVGAVNSSPSRRQSDFWDVCHEHPAEFAVLKMNRCCGSRCRRTLQRVFGPVPYPAALRGRSDVFRRAGADALFGQAGQIRNWKPAPQTARVCVNLKDRRFCRRVSGADAIAHPRTPRQRSHRVVWIRREDFLAHLEREPRRWRSNSSRSLCQRIDWMSESGMEESVLKPLLCGCSPARELASHYGSGGEYISGEAWRFCRCRRESVNRS